MVWKNSRGYSYKKGVGYVTADGHRVRYRKFKGMRNKKTGQFVRYGDSSFHPNPGGKNIGKAFKG